MKDKDILRLSWKIFNWSAGMAVLNGLAVYISSQTRTIPPYVIALWALFSILIFFSGIFIFLYETKKLFKDSKFLRFFSVFIFAFIEFGIFTMIFYKS